MKVTTSLQNFEPGRISRSNSLELGKLCKYCREILAWRWLPCGSPRLAPTDDVSESDACLDTNHKYLEHHESWSELKACGDGGCTLCKLFRAGWECFVLGDRKMLGNETGFRLFLIYENGNIFRSAETATRFEGFHLRNRNGDKDTSVRPEHHGAGPFFQIMAPSGW